MVDTIDSVSGARRRKGKIVGVVVGSLILTGVIGLRVAWAAQRGGNRHLIAIDSTSGAGGAAASATYRETDSAVGQESVSGPAGGATFQVRAGVVQAWTASPRSVAGAWTGYE